MLISKFADFDAKFVHTVKISGKRQSPSKVIQKKSKRQSKKESPNNGWEERELYNSSSRLSKQFCWRRSVWRGEGEEGGGEKIVLD